MRSMVMEVSGGHVVKSDGIKAGVGRWMVYEVTPGFWTDSLTWMTWPG